MKKIILAVFMFTLLVPVYAGNQQDSLEEGIKALQERVEKVVPNSNYKELKALAAQYPEDTQTIRQLSLALKKLRSYFGEEELDYPGVKVGLEGVYKAFLEIKTLEAQTRVKDFLGRQICLVDDEYMGLKTLAERIEKLGGAVPQLKMNTAASEWYKTL